MKRFVPLVIGVLLALVACLPVLADPCYQSYSPAQSRASYAAPLKKAIPAPHVRSYAHGRDVVLFAEAYYPTIDYAVKDVFIFTGPPPAPLPGLVLGVNQQGQEVRGLPVGQQQAQAQSGDASDESQAQGVRPVLGMEEDQTGGDELARSPKGGARREADGKFVLALENACGSCHGLGGRAKGDFSLFRAKGALATNLDWKVIKEATTPDARTKAPARMPPASSGKQLPAFARLEISRRAN